MNVLIAIDSFKESLSSQEAANAIKEGILKADKNTNVKAVPIADGGEGTVSALSQMEGARKYSAQVTGPLFEKVAAEYCVIEKNKTAVIEIAAAAGLNLVPEDKRNPLEATTYGVGEIIIDAINKGCRNFIIGLGGSATNDGGIGMLSALGFSFLDNNKMPVELSAKGLEKISFVSYGNVLPKLKNCSFKVACDVKNPLYGKNGASSVFGAQKGASKEEISKLDKWLKAFADLTDRKGGENALYAGAGAAGGLGFAFKNFLNAELRSGIDIILDAVDFEKDVLWADIVITGEGRLDAQTVMGKAPSGVADISKKHNKTVIAFSGCVSKDAAVCNEHGIDAYFPILRSITTTSEALESGNAYSNLKNTACQVFNLIKAVK